jgi:UDP-N-acetylmuramoyl-L-alanine---L-glutamate ligase
LSLGQEPCLIIKSPGIPGTLLNVTYTTATNIFFANTKGITIGITGTKGKSTTVSLLYSILKRAGCDAYLVGNIGQPMLPILDRLKHNSISVIELSSYQLSDIKYSPHIAVFLNIYPEHIPYHQTYDNYLSSKVNITKFQSNKDYFIYNSSIDDLNQINSKAIKIPIANLPKN